MASAQQGALSVGWYRWVVCGLLFVATTVNYLDRQVISVLKPVLEKEMGWNQIDYSNIVVCFQLAHTDLWLTFRTTGSSPSRRIRWGNPS
ncbi:MAG: hypothetical protein NTY01_13620 [Verrucomicrobia bacterium]|nr:hypothetical protein [Verrucomicrobiota bacterium]